MEADDEPSEANYDEGCDINPGRILSQLLDPSSKNPAKDSLEVLLNTFKASEIEHKIMTDTIGRSIENIVKQRSPEGQPVRWCYLPALPTNHVTGKCLSLDFGCSDHYFQVAVCDVVSEEGSSGEGTARVATSTEECGQAFLPLDNQAFLLTRTIRYADMHTFCDFVAACVRKVMHDSELAGTREEPIFMGVAAGFDARVKPQANPTVACVPLTYKDYHMRGFINKDFVAKFHAAFERANIHVRIVTVMNDTVSTLLSGTHRVFLTHRREPDADCSIGVVSNRCGANMSYLETDQDFLDMCSTDKRLLLRCSRGNGYCAIVNTESGMWVGSKGELMDRANIVEKHLSVALNTPIRFECIASGFWYPEQLRRCILVLKSTGAIGANVPDCQNLSASVCHEIFFHCDHWRSRRTASGLVALIAELKEALNAVRLTESDVSAIAEVCWAIVGRTGQVLANGIMALANKVYGKAFPTKMVVAYCGTMFRLAQLKPAIEACLKLTLPTGISASLMHTDVAFGSAVSAITVGRSLQRKTVPQ